MVFFVLRNKIYGGRGKIKNKALLTIGEMAAPLKVPLTWLCSRTRVRGSDGMSDTIILRH
jgi:hypothetical protein